MLLVNQMQHMKRSNHSSTDPFTVHQKDHTSDPVLTTKGQTKTTTKPRFCLHSYTTNGQSGRHFPGISGTFSRLLFLLIWFHKAAGQLPLVGHIKARCHFQACNASSGSGLIKEMSSGSNLSPAISVRRDRSCQPLCVASGCRVPQGRFKNTYA